MVKPQFTPKFHRCRLCLCALLVLILPMGAIGQSADGKQLWFYRLILEVNFVSAEFYINDIPVAYVDPVDSGFSMTVNHYLVDGKNELAVLISPGPNPSKGSEGQKPVKLEQAASVVGRIVKTPMGVMPGEQGEKTLVTLTWRAKKGASVTLPMMKKQGTDAGKLFGKWLWQESPKLKLDAKTVAEVEKVLKELHAAITKGDEEKYVKLNNIKIEEQARAFGMSFDQIKSKSLDAIEEQKSTAKASLEPIDSKNFDLRIVGDGRMIDCIAKDWQPIIRSLKGGDQGHSRIFYDVKLARIGGKLMVVR